MCRFMEKTTSLDQLKRNFPSQPGFHQPFSQQQDDSMEPIPIHMEEEEQTIQTPENHETMNNIIQYYEEMQQPLPVQQQQQQEPNIMKRRIPYLSILIRTIFVFFLFCLFLSPFVQTQLRNRFSSMYNVTGFWSIQGILLFSFLFSLIYSLIDILYVRFF